MIDMSSGLNGNEIDYLLINYLKSDFFAIIVCLSGNIYVLK
jgi:hypothetical protein